jgi:hypothetical protein
VAESAKMKAFYDSALVKKLFKSVPVRSRMAGSHLGIILSGFITDLHERGYSRKACAIMFWWWNISVSGSRAGEFGSLS